jgi:hypothetical protein
MGGITLRRTRSEVSLQAEKNWLFADSDSGGECAVVLYSQNGTCRLNGVARLRPCPYLGLPANWVCGLQPCKLGLTAE